MLVPATARLYLNRQINVKGMIDHNTICYQAFVKRGWSWGGDWQAIKGYVDYHHFEKDPKAVLGKL